MKKFNWNTDIVYNYNTLNVTYKPSAKLVEVVDHEAQLAKMTEYKDAKQVIENIMRKIKK